MIRSKILIYEKIKFFFFIVTAVVALGLILGLPRLSIPVAIAFVLYLILSPLVQQLTKTGLNKNLSILIVFLGLIGFTVYPIVKITPVLKVETENFQHYYPKVERYLRNQYQRFMVDFKMRTGLEVKKDLLDNALAYITENSKKVLFNVPHFLASMLEWLLVAPLLLFFLLKDGRRFKFKILHMTPNFIFERFYNLSNQFNKKLGDYIFAKFVEAAIVGILVTGGLFIIGVRFSFLLGILAAVTNIIPYVGPFLGMIPAIIWGLVEYGVEDPMFTGIVVLYLSANVLDLAFVFPILVSKIVNLHPISVIVSVIVGSHYFGILGMVISIPLAAALKIVFLQVYHEIYVARVK